MVLLLDGSEESHHDVCNKRSIKVLTIRGCLILLIDEGYIKLLLCTVSSPSVLFYLCIYVRTIPYFLD